MRIHDIFIPADHVQFLLHNRSSKLTTLCKVGKMEIDDVLQLLINKFETDLIHDLFLIRKMFLTTLQEIIEPFNVTPSRNMTLVIHVNNNETLSQYRPLLGGGNATPNGHKYTNWSRIGTRMKTRRLGVKLYIMNQQQTHFNLNITYTFVCRSHVKLAASWRTFGRRRLSAGFSRTFLI